jgi:hypothetical protein
MIVEKPTIARKAPNKMNCSVDYKDFLKVVPYPAQSSDSSKCASSRDWPELDEEKSAQ